MIKLTYEFADQAALLAHLTGSATTPAAKADAPNPKPVATKPTASPTASPASAPKPEASAPKNKSPKDEPAGLDYVRDVQPLIPKLAAAEGKGAAAVIAILATFGVKKGSELAPEQLADAKAAFEATLAVEPDLS